MKKLTLISLLYFGFSIPIAFAQNPLPVAGSYLYPTTPTNLCQLTSGFGIRNLLINPGPYPQNFILSLQLYVVSSASVPGTNTSYPWGATYPECYAGSQGVYPISLDNCTVNTCTLSNPQPVWNAATNSFDWYISCTGTIYNIELISYDIYLDCSLFSELNTGSALYLIQKWSYNGTPLLDPPIAIPITFPSILAPNNLDVPANFGNTEEWLFAYQNTGTGPAHIQFDFNIDACSAYNPGNVYYTTGLTPPPFQSSTWSLYTGNNQVVIPVNESLFIVQEATITDCATNLCNLPPPPTDPIYAHFSWQCDITPNAFCSECYEEEYLTELHFISEDPTFTVTRALPSYNQALHNPKCGGSTTDWIFEVTNTSQFTTLPEIVVEVANPHPTSLSLVSSSSGLSITQNCPSPCNASIIDVELINLTPPALVPCTATIAQPVAKYKVSIIKLPPGEKIQFKMVEYHCCSEETLFFDMPKFFNQWQISAVCKTACVPFIITPTPPAIPNDNAVIAGFTGISGYATEPAKDVNLAVSFTNNLPHTVVPNNDPPPYYKFSPEVYHANISELFGNIDDQQAFGYSAATSTKMSGIIKVDIKMLTEGLLVTNPNHVYFEIPSSIISGGFEWKPFTYAGDFPCDATVYSDPAEPPCFYPPINSPAYPGIACSTYNYCLYFRTSDLPTGTDPSVIFDASIAETKFFFKYYACCTAYAQSFFEISFSILGNTADCPPGPISDCDPASCFLPLSKINDYTTVHCPGCKFPGIVVNSYRMERMSLGYEDANNDRIADNTTTPIQYSTGSTPNSYSDYDEIKLNHSTYGDLLNDFSISNFTDGDNSTGGYDYCTMKEQDIHLNALQLYRDFPFSGATGIDNFNAEVLGFVFYIDIDGTGCLQCDSFYYDPSLVYHTDLKLTVDASSPAWSNFFERGVSPDDDKLLFTFTEGYLNSLIDIYNNSSSNLPAGIAFNFNGATTPISHIDYDVNQKYRLRTFYRVCGNYHDGSQTDLNEYVKEADITDYMYLIGAARTLGSILSNLPNDNRPPNTITEMENDFSMTFGTNASSPCSSQLSPLPCTSCGYTNADQTNFGDAFYFFCEPSGGRHKFLGTRCVNNTRYRNDLTSYCGYFIRIETGSILADAQKMSHWPGNPNQFFKFEYKPLNLFPKNISIVPPTGWHFAASGGMVNITVNSWIHNWTYTSNSIPIGVTYSAGPLSFDLSNLVDFNCYIMKNPNSGYWIGDEFSYYQIDIPLLPDYDCPTNASSHVPDDSQVMFGNNSESCNLNNSGCNYSVLQNNMNFFINNNFFPPNPNLQCQIWPASITASTNTITWKFQITNPLITGSTEVRNVYIAVPSVSYLNNWSASYTLSGNYPYDNSSPFSAIIQNLQPDNNGYLWLIPECPGYPCNYLQINGSVAQGTISATYTECTDPANFDFIWGWNCEKETNNPPATAALCEKETMNFEIFNGQALLVPEPTLGTVPGSYDGCHPTAQLTATACFKSIFTGELKPKMINVLNTNIQIVPGTFAITSCGGNATYTINAITGEIEVTNPNPPNPPSEFMFAADCFCISFEFIPLCNGGEDLQLHVQILWEDYCGDDHPPAENYLPLIPYSGTSYCLDCFGVTKTATPSVAGIYQQVTFDIEVCNHSLNSSLPLPVCLSDIFPPSSNFVITNDPANLASGPWQIAPLPPCPGTVLQPCCTTITVTGHFENEGMNCPDPDFTNTANLNGNACTDPLPPATATSSVCVDVVCPSPSSIVYPTGTNSATISSPVTGQAIRIEGQFTVDASITFDQCAIYMDEGAQIIVNSAQNLTLTGTTILGCTHMWQGILLAGNGAGINAAQSSIRDAHIGIEANFDNPIDLRNSSILDCITGISINTGGLFGPALTVIGCDFGKVSPQFKMQYQTPVMQPDFGNVGRAGILLNNSVIATIGLNSAQSENRFFNLNFGIEIRNTTVSAVNCSFKNIVADAFYANSPYLVHAPFGVAVDARCDDPNQYFYLRFDPLFSGLTTIDGSNIGVNTDLVSANIQKIKMTNLREGIKSMNTGLSRFVRAISCNISASNFGIDWVSNDGASTMTAEGNIITVNSPSGIGIYLAEQKAGNSANYNLFGNYITTLSSTAGISTRAVNRAFIQYNTVNTQGGAGSPGTAGISLAGGQDITLDCNNVNNSLPVTDQYSSYGALVNQSYASKFTCNNFNDCGSGMFFTGVKCDNALLKSNEIHSGWIGLYLDPSAVIGKQPPPQSPPSPYHGNRWTGSFGTGFGAVNWNAANQTQLGLNLFTILDPSAPGGNAAHLPAFPNGQPSWPQNIGWFVAQFSGSSFSCEPFPGIPYCGGSIPPPPSGGGDDDEKRRSIARDSSLTAEYIAESKAIARQSLFDELTADPALLSSDTVFQNFVSANQSSAIGILHDARIHFSETGVTDSAQQANLLGAINQVRVYADSIFYLDSLKAVNPAGNYSAQRAALISGMTAKQQQAGAIAEAVLIADSIKLSEAQYDNNLTAPVELPHINEKYVNEKVLQFYAQGIGSVEAGYEQLLQVAMQCPASGGASVITARVLVGMVNDSIIYDDKTVCQQQGYFRSHAFEKSSAKPEVEIIPNPATESVTFKVSNSNEGLCFIRLLNSLGETVFEGSFACKDKVYHLNISRFKPGVYHAEIRANDSIFVNRRLSIIR